MLPGMERIGRATAPAGRGAARWAVLCALLLGLFLMHGSPASAAGCHPAGTGPRTAGAPVAGAMGGEHRPVVTVPMGHGSSAASCVSVQARDRVPLAAPGAALPWTPPRPPVAATVREAAAEGGRAPPGGRELLLRVCVARR